MSKGSKTKKRNVGAVTNLEKDGTLTIDSAISKCEDIVKNKENSAEEIAIHKQLIRWLRELQSYRIVTAKQKKQAPVNGLSYAEAQVYRQAVEENARRRVESARFHSKVNMTLQIGQDAAVIAAGDVLGLGPERAGEFLAAYVETVNEIAAMMSKDIDDDPDYDYTKGKTDEVVLKVVGPELFQPWEVRYGEKSITEKAEAIKAISRKGEVPREESVEEKLAREIVQTNNEPKGETEHDDP